MEFRVLGPLDVLVDGRPAALSAPRPRALLAGLLVRAGQVVPADVLADVVWNGNSPASASSVLRMYVTQLRRALGSDRIVTRPRGYLLVVDDGELDATRFEGLFADARRTLAGGNPRLARSLCARALDLWRGNAYSDTDREGSVGYEASRLDELRLECLESRIEADLRLGRQDGVLAELRQLVALHPLRENFRCQLMLALYRSGQQADALACFREGRTALLDGLGLEPGPRLRELERRILEQDPTLDNDGSDHRPARLPLPATRTIGRDRELAEIGRQLLDPRTRLLTLVGPGGIGKTRLAIEAARALDEEVADGALVVDLSSVADSRLLLPTVGRALGLREGAKSWAELLADHLRDLELLLVLDNLEHLVDGVEAVADLVRGAPRLTVLATSRRPLRLTAELVREVGPLDEPAALELLVERAAAAGAEVDPSWAELKSVNERLDGLPLAIELAAPWFRSVSANELVRLLNSRLSVLGRAPRDAPARHRTMRSAIDWSFELLTLAAQRLAGRLSLFHGEFTIDAIRAVGGIDSVAEPLDELVDASIVHSADGRYHLLEVVREYAAELPSADDEGRDLHAAFFVAFAEAAEGELAGVDQGAWLDQLESNHDNLRAALDRLVQSGDPAGELRLAAALGRFWYIRGYLSEGLERLQAAIERARSGQEPALARALRTASALALLRGDYPLARSFAERARDLYLSLGEESGVVRSLSNLGAILHAQGDLGTAAATLDECVRLSELLGDERLTALARNNRGDVALSQGDLETASDQFTRSLAYLRAANDVANLARCLYNLGAVAVEQGRLDDAELLLGESLDLSHRVNDSEDLAWCLIAFAGIAAVTERYAEGTMLLSCARSLLDRIGATMKPFEQGSFERTSSRLRSALGEAQFDQAFAAGAQLTTDDALHLARSREVSRTPNLGTPQP